MQSIERRKRYLLKMMLFHTLIGHPLASMLIQLELYRLANLVHFYTLPYRSRRKLQLRYTVFNPDRRLYSIDRFWIPVCSLLESLGRYDLASRVWKYGPHEIALSLGACGYYKAESEGEMRKRLLEEQKRRGKMIREMADIEDTLTERGFSKVGHKTQTGYPWTHNKHYSLFDYAEKDKELLRRWLELAKYLYHNLDIYE